MPLHGQRHSGSFPMYTLSVNGFASALRTSLLMPLLSLVLMSAYALRRAVCRCGCRLPANPTFPSGTATGDRSTALPGSRNAAYRPPETGAGARLHMAPQRRRAQSAYGAGPTQRTARAIDAGTLRKNELFPRAEICRCALACSPRHLIKCKKKTGVDFQWRRRRWSGLRS